MSQQQENISRVRAKIGYVILTFFKHHKGLEFHADELRQFVIQSVPFSVAPGSPDRIMRDLRQDGLIDYRVIDRRNSLYLAI